MGIAIVSVSIRFHVERFNGLWIVGDKNRPALRRRKREGFTMNKIMKEKLGVWILTPYRSPRQATFHVPFVRKHPIQAGARSVGVI